MGRIRKTESLTQTRQLENCGVERPSKGHLSCGFQTYLAASLFKHGILCKTDESSILQYKVLGFSLFTYYLYVLSWYVMMA